MTRPAGTAALPQREQRLALLTAQVSRLRVGRRTGGATDTGWLLRAAWAGLTLGPLLIGLGWYGSAQTILPFEQIPYLISGGLLGLAVVIVGGFLYFSYWLTRMVQATTEAQRAAEAHAQRLEHAIGLVALELAALRPLPPPSSAAPSTLAPPLVRRPRTKRVPA